MDQECSDEVTSLMPVTPHEWLRRFHLGGSLAALVNVPAV